MAKSLNKVQLIGNLGRDPEMKYAPGGQAVTQFSIAVARNSKKDGEQTDWFKVICWDKLAEIADQYLKKGHRVYVEGRLQIREYTGWDGSKKITPEVAVDDMIMLSGDGQKAKQPVAAKGKPYNPTEWLDEVDEMGDVPF
jgi:single-strand DNA-binding protein